ncbi:dihydrodipicolinate synthase family protein [Schlesneria paludicola]|uniref:dihydrodipicolinate synthase family protein n=1 Tax=Schlesneria paludicola TaxID=360056 RepID=UPI00029AF64C|nr:dihydrodipicolinate synthase family protein [Schlesneria paludicola]
MAKPIQGVLPIAHTPFLDDDSIDVTSLARQLDWAFAAGADGFATGMVSELIRLTFEERTALTKTLAELAHGRGTFVAGVGAESTRQAIQYAQIAEKAGADGVMATPPMTTRAPAAAVRDYFVALAESISIPVIVQDASGYVGQPIPLDVSVGLLKRFGRDKILFKPEASPIGPNLSALRDATGGEARIFDGSGGVCLVDCYRRGIDGTMPGMEFLTGIVALWKALERKDDAAIYRLYFPICALVSLQLQAGLDGFLAVEKYVLHKRGLFTTDRRRPPYAYSLDNETRAELDRLLKCLDDVVNSGS